MDTLDQNQQFEVDCSAGHFVFKRLSPKERRFARTVVASQLRNGVPAAQIDDEVLFMTNTIATLSTAVVTKPEKFTWDNAEDVIILELLAKVQEAEATFRG